MEGFGIFIVEVQPRDARQESRDVGRVADSAPNDQAPVTWRPMVNWSMMDPWKCGTAAWTMISKAIISCMCKGRGELFRGWVTRSHTGTAIPFRVRPGGNPPEAIIAEFWCMSLPESGYHAARNWEPHSTIKENFLEEPWLWWARGKVFFIRNIEIHNFKSIKTHIVCFPTPSFPNPAKAFSNCPFIDMMVPKKQETLNKLRTRVTSFQSHFLILRDSFQLRHLVRRHTMPHFLC